VRGIEELARCCSNRAIGTLRLGTTPTLGPICSSPIIADLHRAAPGLRLYAARGDPGRAGAGAFARELDVLLGPLPIRGDDLESSRCSASRSSWWRRWTGDLARGPGPPGALAGQACCRSTRATICTARRAGWPSAHGMALSPDYEGTSLDSLHMMAASGLGLTLLPQLYLQSDVGGISGWRSSRWRVEGAPLGCPAWRRGTSMEAASA